MARWNDTPALILSRHLDVLAANPAGMLLFPGLDATDNMLIYLFTDPGARELHADWAGAGSYSVAALRALAGAEHDPRLVDLVGRLAIESPEFARLWDRHDVRHKTHRRLPLRHPLVGELTVDYESFTVRSDALRPGSGHSNHVSPQDVSGSNRDRNTTLPTSRTSSTSTGWAAATKSP